MIKCLLQAKKFENCLIKYAKTKKSSLPEAKIFEIWFFSNPRESIFFMRVQPPLDKLGGLTWKGAPLIAKFSKPPSTFDTPKLQPLLFKGWGGGSSYGISNAMIA